MPTAPKHPCSKAGCPNLTDRKYCPEHAPIQASEDSEKAWRTSKETASTRGYGARWRKLRLMILARDPVCVLCRQRPSTTVDHVMPKSRGGQDEESNLRGLCSRCHAAKSTAEGNQARRYGVEEARRTTPETRRPRS